MCWFEPGPVNHLLQGAAPLRSALMNIREIITAAAKMVVHVDLIEAQIDELNEKLRTNDTPEVRAELAKYLDALEEMEDRVSYAFARWACDPLIRPYMMCWCLEVSGKPDMELEKDFSDDVRRELEIGILTKPDEFAAKVGGLMPNVRAAIIEFGITPRQTMIHKERWSYHIAISDTEIERLNHFLRLKFHKAIDSGILVLTRSYYGFRFTALPHANAARAWLDVVAEEDKDKPGA
jgi:hypothetical protein